MKLINPTATNLDDIDRQARFFTLAAVIVLAITALVLGLSILFTNQQTKKVVNTRQELAGLKETAANVQSLQTYAQSNREQITKIPDLFPTEDDFVNVLQDIETVVKKTDPQGIVKVSAAKPTKVQNQNTIPLLIHLNTNANGLINFLREFERLPYILQIVSLEMSHEQNLVDSADINIQVRLYVADPFNS